MTTIRDFRTPPREATEEEAAILAQLGSSLDNRWERIESHRKRISGAVMTGEIGPECMGPSPSELAYMEWINKDNTFIHFKWRLTSQMKLEDLIVFRSRGGSQEWASKVHQIHKDWWPLEWKAYQRRKRAETSALYRLWYRWTHRYFEKADVMMYNFREK